jgi:hypothetical protein
MLPYIAYMDPMGTGLSPLFVGKSVNDIYKQTNLIEIEWPYGHGIIV